MNQQINIIANNFKQATSFNVYPELINLCDLIEKSTEGVDYGLIFNKIFPEIVNNKNICIPLNYQFYEIHRIFHNWVSSISMETYSNYMKNIGKACKNAINSLIFSTFETNFEDEINVEQQLINYVKIAKIRTAILFNKPFELPTFEITEFASNKMIYLENLALRFSKLRVEQNNAFSLLAEYNHDYIFRNFDLKNETEPIEGSVVFVIEDSSFYSSSMFYAYSHIKKMNELGYKVFIWSNKVGELSFISKEITGDCESIQMNNKNLIQKIQKNKFEYAFYENSTLQIRICDQIGLGVHNLYLDQKCGSMPFDTQIETSGDFVYFPGEIDSLQLKKINKDEKYLYHTSFDEIEVYLSNKYSDFKIYNIKDEYFSFNIFVKKIKKVYSLGANCDLISNILKNHPKFEEISEKIEIAYYNIDPVNKIIVEAPILP